jgi:nucleotide-binding universal stress UspA family protein
MTTNDVPNDPAHRNGTIIAGYDGSASALAAVHRAVSLGSRLNTSVRVITTWKTPVSIAGGYPLEWNPADDAQKTVDTLTAELFPQGAPVWFSTDVVEGAPAPVLIKESAGAEMLVVGSRGHGGFAGLLLGSVSSACAEHAHCPVLVMHTDLPAPANTSPPSETLRTARNGPRPRPLHRDSSNRQPTTPAISGSLRKRMNHE